MRHVCAVLFGFSYGGYCSAVIVFLKHRFEDCLGMAIGLYFFTCGLASIAGPVVTGQQLRMILGTNKFKILLGSLVDGLGTYSVAFLTMGIVVAFSSVILGLVPLVDHFKKDNANANSSGTSNEGFTDVVTVQAVQV